MQDPKIEGSRVDLQEGCKKEQSVEDQFDEPHEADCEDVAEEDKVGENLKCDDLMNISVCADVNNYKEEATKFEELSFLKHGLKHRVFMKPTQKLHL